MGQTVILSLLAPPKLDLYRSKILRVGEPLTEASLRGIHRGPDARPVRAFTSFKNGFRAAVRRPENGVMTQQIIEIQHLVDGSHADHRMFLAYGPIDQLPAVLTPIANKTLYLARNNEFVPLNGQIIPLNARGILITECRGMDGLEQETAELRKKMEFPPRHLELMRNDYADLWVDTLLRNVARALDESPPAIAAKTIGALERIYRLIPSCTED